MTRAERAAEEAYPPFVVKTLYGEFDCNASYRLLFWRGYQQALDEMLALAVEGEVYKFAHYSYVKERNRDDLTKYLSKFNDGDKVRIVVLKAEEE